jgi:chitin-binding protein
MNTFLSGFWYHCKKNVVVSRHANWRDGARIGDTTDTGYVDSSVRSSMTCTYSVSAYDAAGNRSASSSAVTVTARGGSTGSGKGKP